jgi:hypothetical protein
MSTSLEEKPIGDMYLAAAFLSYDIPLIRIERKDARRQKFIFCGTPRRVFTEESGVVMMLENPTLEEIETRFIAKTLMFPPSYPDSIRRIKASIHSGDSDG